MNFREQFLQILKKWPIDAAKESRDYGLHLRSLFKNSLTTGIPFRGSAAENIKKLESLQRLVNNTHYQAYPPISKYGATEMPLNELEAITNDKFMQDFNKGMNFKDKIRNLFKKKSTDSIK